MVHSLLPTTSKQGEKIEHTHHARPSQAKPARAADRANADGGAVIGRERPEMKGFGITPYCAGVPLLAPLIYHIRSIDCRVPKKRQAGQARGREGGVQGEELCGVSAGVSHLPPGGDLRLPDAFSPDTTWQPLCLPLPANPPSYSHSGLVLPTHTICLPLCLPAPISF